MTESAELQKQLDTLALTEAKLRVKLLKKQIEIADEELYRLDALAGFDINEPEEALKFLLTKGWELITSPIGEKLILSAFFIYAWKEAGDNKKLTKSDIMLGMAYGFTIPPALEGGIVANGYAIAALAILGINYVDGTIMDVEEWKSYFNNSIKPWTAFDRDKWVKTTVTENPGPPPDYSETPV